MIALVIAFLAMPQAASAAPPAAGQGAPSGAVAGVSMGVLVRPATVTVGQPFSVIVRVRAPLGADIGFPVGPDSGLSVEAVDPRAVRAASDTGAVDRTATYRLVAWDTGGQSARLGEVVVTSNGQAVRYRIAGDTVRVNSVLPADTARRKPKPARDVMLAVRPWWQWALLGAAVAALLWAVTWWWRRRASRRGLAAPLAPIEAAHRAFARIDALDLLAAGERGRYVALNVDVLREYLAGRVHGAERSHTSTELLAALRDVSAVPAERLAPLLAEMDLVKFARRPVSLERAGEIARESRSLVDDVERTLAEQEAAAAEAEKAA